MRLRRRFGRRLRRRRSRIARVFGRRVGTRF